MGLRETHARLLENRGIDAETAAKYGVESCDRAGDWISIPYVLGDQVVNHKFRTLSGEKQFAQDKSAVKTFWNFNAITDPTLADQPLIITEGEFDALAAIQAGYPRSISVPDGAPAEAQGEEDRGVKYSYVVETKGALSGVKEIILCTDGDGPGVNLLNDLAIRLGKARCKWVRYPKGCKDLNDAFRLYGPKGVTETINRAKWMRVDGLYRMSELPPVVAPAPHKLGMSILDDHYRPRLGDFTVVTGIPGHGKTSFINEVCARVVERFDWPVAIASFEQKPQTDHRRNLRTLHSGKLQAWMSQEQLAAADRWIDDNFVFIAPSEDDDVTLKWTLERCAAAAIQYGAKLVVIDPWNEMDHVRPSDVTLTEYVGVAIREFRRLAHKYGVHVIVAAHPAKLKRNKDGAFEIPSLYDISDSAHWYNKSDVGIVVHRLDPARTLIRVAKSRYHDEIGTPGDVEAHFVREVGRYTIHEEPDMLKGAA